MVRGVWLLSAGREGEAAGRWLETVPGITVHRAGGPADVFDTADLLWIHALEVPADQRLVQWLEAGGRLLLTLDAVTLPSRLGLEPVAPDDRRSAVWQHADDEFWLEEYRSFHAFPHIRGLAGFGPHPLFRGLDQGTYTWAPTEGEPYSWATYRGVRPARGRGVAVERSFIHLNPERLVAWEYEVGEGGILCLGAFVGLDAPDDQLRRQLHALLTNAVAGDAIPGAGRRGPVTWWPADGAAAHRDSDEPEAAAGAPVPVTEAWDEWPPSGSPLVLESPGREDQPWTLAGRRALAVGSEGSGLSEIWVHPYRVLGDARLEVGGRAAQVTSVRVAPDEVVRVLRAGEVELTERVTTALDQGLVFWSIVADAPVALRFRWTTDLRRMWPYPAGRSPAQVHADDGTPPRALRVELADEPPCFEVQAAAGELVAPDPAGQRALRLEARGQRVLRLVFAAGSDSAELGRALASLRRRKLRAFRQDRMLHARRLEQRLTALETPEPPLDRAFAWAKVRMDSFLAETPGVGRSLLAGYAASRPGWGDGRPGYAWYFGRDACWTAFATLAAGDRDVARDVLRFLGRTQDVSGKVLHEYTTSGLAHYDAADSTPLWLLLAGRYAQWTGDLPFLEKLWPRIESAWRFCLETDRDGDGVIENHRVGHGWIEHGPLGDLHVTLYLAACWLAALEALQPVARALGRAGFADELHARADSARATIERRFRAGADYALGLEADGRPRCHPTAMLAVPLLLGAARADLAGGWLDAIASQRFSAPWGVRMVASDDPLYQPAGYHTGAVWPLYTGWVSLAEWAAGRWPAALSHLLANAALAEERARGAFDEVLHGDERRAAGICPDQAWSAAMVVSPVVEGLWGLRPDGLGGSLRLDPWLPPGWPEMALRRVRVGGTTLDVRLRRRPGRVVLQVERRHGPPLRIDAGLRADPPALRVAVDEQELGAGRARFEASGAHEVSFELSPEG